MGQRTVTECDGCGGIPAGDDYPWVEVEWGENAAIACSVYCTSLVLREWDAPVAALDPDAAFARRPSSGEQGRPDPEAGRGPSAEQHEVIHDMVMWLVDTVEALARRVAENARPHREGGE